MPSPGSRQSRKSWVRSPIWRGSPESSDCKNAHFPLDLKIIVAKSSFYPQYKKVTEVIRERILNGSYSLKLFPSERRLADELGVNYMTVRRGLQILEKENILVRQPNGRMRVKRIQQGKKTHLNFCFLSPSSSGDIDIWRRGVHKATAKLSCTVRNIFFMNWNDPILLDCLKGFDGIFLYPPPEDLPEEVASHLRHSEHPVIIVDEDLSSYGVPSIQLFPPVSIQKLLDHLAALGHTRIGCLNTQPGHRGILDRINQWRYWMASHGLTGHLADHQAPLHEDLVVPAYDVMKKILEDPDRQETAWVCITTPPALGAMRAMLDKGLQPGRDLAICSVNGEGVASVLNPPLTSLEAADPFPFLSICLDWMLRGGGHWRGPLLMRPNDVPLVIRESTQPGAGRGILP